MNPNFTDWDGYIITAPGEQVRTAITTVEQPQNSAAHTSSGVTRGAIDLPNHLPLHISIYVHPGAIIRQSQWTVAGGG